MQALTEAQSKRRAFWLLLEDYIYFSFTWHLYPIGLCKNEQQKTMVEGEWVVSDIVIDDALISIVILQIPMLWWNEMAKQIQHAYDSML